MADLTTRWRVDNMDHRATYLNCLTSAFLSRAAIPMYFDTEKELMDAALMSLSGTPPEAMRIVIIPNTLFLQECIVSEAIAEELRGMKGTNIDLDDKAEELASDNAGNLLTRI